MQATSGEGSIVDTGVTVKANEEIIPSILAAHVVSSCDNFHDGGSYHIETSPLFYRANQWTGFCMIGTLVMKKLINWTALDNLDYHQLNQMHKPISCR